MELLGSGDKDKESTKMMMIPTIDNYHCHLHQPRIKMHQKQERININEKKSKEVTDIKMEQKMVSPTTMNLTTPMLVLMEHYPTSHSRLVLTCTYKDLGL